MPEPENRPLRVFLCHSSHDKPVVRDLYRRLETEGWMDVWLDEEKLFPGQDWNFEIEKAVEASQIVLVFLTNNSVTKEGYIQKELRLVLDVALNMPEETIFVIPLKLEECPVPRRLQTWQWLNYFPESDRDRAYQRLLVSLKMRAARLGISTVNPKEQQARLEAEKIKQQAAEDKATKEKEAQARKAAEEHTRLLEEKKQQEKRDAEERARKASEARAAKLKVDQDQKAVEEKPKVRERKPISEMPVEPQISVARKPVVEKSADAKARSFWTTLPGILTGIAAVLTAAAGCVTAVSSLRTIFPTPIPTAIIAFVTQTPVMTMTDIPLSTSTALSTNTPAPVLGIGSSMISPKDGVTLLYVPAGKFTMGSDNGGADEKPVHTVTLDSFWIDQTEVTNSMYAKCVQDGKCDPPSSTSSSTRQSYYGNSNFDNFPVIYVSWNAANKYCAWADRRLPTEAEWEKAARGTDGRTYPWGNDAPNPNLLNYNSDVGETTAAGKYPNGASLYGAYDMAGNVWEWVSSLYKPYPYNATDGREDLTASGDRVLRGGAWYLDDFSVRSALRNWNSPTYTYYDVGFRCSRSQ